MATTYQQPRGLTFLFSTEMWERFGFYIIQGLLILFMTNRCGLSDTASSAILGSFTAISYIMPILGGFLADRILGFRHAIILGGTLFVVGYALLAFSAMSLPAGSIVLPQIFYIALSIVAVGNGFFKPNVSSILGELYTKNDRRRDSGFTLFYVGINLGALLATVAGGYIERYLGWSWTFMSASIGLVIGVSIFILGLKRLKGAGRAPAFGSRYTYAWCMVGIYAAIIVSIFTIQSLLTLPALANQLMILVLVVVIVGVLFLAMQEEKIQRRRMLACLILVGLSIVFWAILFQMYFSVNLFSERVVDRTVFGHVLPTPVFIGLESFFIITLGPLLAWFWNWLDARAINPSTPMKFALGILFLVLTFGALLLGVHFKSSSNEVSAWWLVLSYLFLSIGELSLSPVGLSMVTTLVPTKYVGMMMGVWFVALGLGAKLAGVIAGFSAVPQVTAPRSTISPADLASLRFGELPLYSHGFWIYTILALVVGIIALSLVPFIKSLMVENMAGGSV